MSCFLHILGAGEKSSPQETKCSIGFSAVFRGLFGNLGLFGKYRDRLVVSVFRCFGVFRYFYEPG